MVWIPGAGLWAATFIVAGEMIPLVKRPALFGLFGMVFLVASVGGPILGGEQLPGESLPIAI